MYTEYDKYDESYAYCPNCKKTFPRSAIKQIVYPATRDDPEMRFLRGRLRFARENGTAYAAAPFPSMIAIYNSRKD